MRTPREEIPPTPKVIDLVSAVKILHGLSSVELSKLIKDSENNTIQLITENGSSSQIDVEDLAKIPLHLIAKLISCDINEPLFRYMLSGLRLLHTLYDIAPRYPKLEQILLEDIPLLKQMFDLIFYMLIELNNYTQVHQPSGHIILLHPTLVSSSLFLMTGFVSPQFPELANILIHHRKVDKFMDAAFSAIRADVEFLQITLSGQPIDSPVNSSLVASEEPIKHLCQQCEVSLQFFDTLCQDKLFRDHLVKLKELSGKGGILLLVRLILDLNISTSLSEPNYNYVAASISRIKSKGLSILLHLCEAESYLDEVASIPGSLDLAKSVALEVLEILRALFSGHHKELISSSTDRIIPKGLLQLNAMRLADILSDDSNFRSYITTHITEVLATLFLLTHGKFLSSWCASDLLVWEEDATLEYDPFVAAGWVLNLKSESDLLVMPSAGSTIIPCNMPRVSYAHQRTSLLVKVIANLHCFVPEICTEEKDGFLNNFFQCLRKELTRISDGFSSSSSAAEKAAVISRNLRSLLIHAESLIGSFLLEDDVQLLRGFVSQLESLISTPELKMNQAQEDQNAGGYSSPLSRKLSPDYPNNRSGNLIWDKSVLQEVDQFSARGKAMPVIGVADDEPREYKASDKGKPGKSATIILREVDKDNAQNVETSGSDSSSTRGKNSIDQINNVDHIKEPGFGGVQGDEKAENIQSAEQQQRKRKRTIMNEKQSSLLEKALSGEPDMHRHATSLKLWADRLSEHGPEVTPSQIKNWLNNRKARLARQAKDVRGLSEGGDNSGIRPRTESPENPVEDVYVPLAPQVGPQLEEPVGHNFGNVAAESLNIGPAEGQYVMLVDEQGGEIGKGKVNQVHGKWFGINLEEIGTCVVDIIELKSERWARLPHPLESTGTSFDQAEKKLGVMRVLWDSNKLLMLQ